MTALKTVRRYRAILALIARSKRGLDDLLHDLDGMERQFGRDIFSGRYRRALSDAKRSLETRVDGAVRSPRWKGFEI